MKEELANIIKCKEAGILWDLEDKVWWYAHLLIGHECDCPSHKNQRETLIGELMEADHALAEERWRQEVWCPDSEEEFIENWIINQRLKGNQ
jgi:hypothetical protein